MMRKILLLLANIMFLFVVTAQSKAKVKKNRIKSATVVNTKIEDGETVVKKELEVYDANGNKTEESVYLNDRLEKKETYKYNKQDEIIEHVIYNKDGSIKKKVQRKYNLDNKVIEELTYNGQDKLLKKELTEYNAFGEKSTETVYDDSNKLIEKSIYKFDKNGLKTERLTYDAQDRLIGKKTYTYTYR